LSSASWRNTRVVRGPLERELTALKKESGKNLTILGSGSIVAQCADAGLVDEFQVMIDPVLLSAGTTFCSGIRKTLQLRLVSTRPMKSGVVLLTYVPM